MNTSKSTKPPIDLIGHIYDAALDAGKWPLVVQQITAALDSKSALLRLMDRQCEDVSFVIANGYDESRFQDYREHYIHIDPFNTYLMDKPVGTVGSTPQLMPMGEFTKTEYYNEYARPQDIYYAAGGFVARDATRTALLGIQRSKSMGAFEPDELQQLALLTSHLQRAFQLARHIGRLDQQAQATEQLLEKRPFGVILLDEFKRPSFLNQRAETLIRLHSQLDFRNGELSTPSRDSTGKLQQLIRDVIDTSLGIGLSAGGAIQLAAYSPDEEPITVVVTPLRLSSQSFGLSGPRFAATLFIGTRHERRELCHQVLQSLYDLTLAETRLAVELANGRDLLEISEHFGISKHTARTQLKAIFQKTDTRRQAELVKLLLTLPLAGG